MGSRGRLREGEREREKQQTDIILYNMRCVQSTYSVPIATLGSTVQHVTVCGAGTWAPWS